MTPDFQTVRLAGRSVGPDQPAYIVAEIGVNHNGDPDLARRTVEAAHRAGADAVKFQTIDAEASYVPGHPSYDAFKRRGLSIEHYEELLEHSRKLGILLFTTPGDLPSFELCAKLNFPALKISSGLMTNLPLIRKAAGLGVPLVVSTGMAYLWEVARTVHELEKLRFHQTVLLHCVSLYPTPHEAVGLRAIPLMQQAFGYPVGYSDHALGNVACLGAVSLGARMIEKHFILDHGIDAPDGPVSMDPMEFSRLVKDVRALEAMLRRQGKEPHPDEVAARPRTHRCLVARTDIPAGRPLTADLVGLMRPLGAPGLAPEFYDVVLGKTTARALKRNDPIGWNDLLR